MNGIPEGSVDVAEAIPFERNIDIMGGGECFKSMNLWSFDEAFIPIPHSRLPERLLRWSGECHSENWKDLVQAQ